MIPTTTGAEPAVPVAVTWVAALNTPNAVGAENCGRTSIAYVPAVAMVPVMDMLRDELHPNGAFNATEYGTVADPELFRAIRAYSPYHNVEDGAAYPAVLLTAGEFDPRVDAYHAKKMTARLQAATSSGQPVLLRVESGGHGLGSSLDQRVSELADVYAFLFDRLGVDYRPTARRA